MTRLFRIRVLMLSIVSLSYSTMAGDTPISKPRVDDNTAIMTIGFKTNAYKVGDPILIDITLKNSGANSITIATTGIPIYYNFSLETNAAEKVPFTRYGMRLFPDRIVGSRGIRDFKEIKPGESVTVKVNIARIYDLTVFGEYKLTVSRIIDVGNKNFGTVVSNILTFKVEEPPNGE